MPDLLLIISVKPIFNPESVKVFDRFSLKDSVIFYNLLLANYLDLFMTPLPKTEPIFYLNKSDQNFLPKGFFPDTINFHFWDYSKSHAGFENLQKNIFVNYDNIILIHSNTIGLSGNDIVKILGFLKREEDCVLIGKSASDSLVFSAHNNLNAQSFESFLNNQESADKHLSEITRADTFVSMINNFLSFNSFTDFKKLYSELSSKKSLPYCSEQMHERFTNLFIEYKDQLDD